MPTSTLALEFSLLLAAIVSVQYAHAFARRLTLLPLAVGGLVTFFIKFAAGSSESGMRLVAAYLAGLLASVALSTLVLIVSESGNTVHNLAFSLIGVSASTVLILAIDPEGGTVGINTRPLMLAEHGSVLTVTGAIVTSVAYWLSHLDRLRSPLYAAWSVACSGQDGAKLVPASMTGLLLRLSLHVGIGCFLMAAVSIHRGVISVDQLGFGFLFELLAATLFVNALASSIVFPSTLYSRIWRGVSCAIGAAIITLATECLRNLAIGSGYVGELRRLALWLLAIVAIISLPLLRRSQAITKSIQEVDNDRTR